jgi:signal transduction histidine kinase
MAGPGSRTTGGPQAAGRLRDLLDLAVEEVGSSLDPRRVVGAILAGGLRIAAAERAALSSWHRETLTVDAWVSGVDAAEVQWAPGAAVRDWLERQPAMARELIERRVVLDDGPAPGQAPPALRGALAGVRHLATMPILCGGEVGGLLLLGRLGGPGFTGEEGEALAALGAVAGMALRNAREHQVATDTVRRLGDAARTKSELLDIAVHELRSPLTVIQGYASLLEAGDLGGLDASGARAVRAVTTKAREAQEIVTTLLTVARLEADELSIERIPVALAPLLHRVRERARARLELTGATLTVSCPTELRAIGDEVLVSRIMDNLVSNALTYSDPPAEVAVVAAREGSQVTLRISDRGPGIAEEERERIFERFVRGRGAERASGTGLGLYVSRECARRMGGDLLLEGDHPGGGSTFTVRLPAV